MESKSKSLGQLYAEMEALELGEERRARGRIYTAAADNAMKLWHHIHELLDKKHKSDDPVIQSAIDIKARFKQQDDVELTGTVTILGLRYLELFWKFMDAPGLYLEQACDIDILYLHLHPHGVTFKVRGHSLDAFRTATGVTLQHLATSTTNEYGWYNKLYKLV